MENDLISRAALINEMESHIYWGDSVIGLLEVAKNAPAVDADNPGWDVFDDLTSAYYGKQMYFTQPDGTIYSRLSCGYITFEKALAEFREAIAKE